MWDRAFVARLRKELPVWVEKGWVAPAGDDAILSHAEAQLARGMNVIPMALAVIGALTLGAGIVLFFAANWSELSKLVKLAVLFGAMWGAYAIAGRGLSRAATASRVVGQAMLLLGVILFGANIHLIAQIYHIDAHYPNGVLMWTLGALVVVWTVPSQPVAVAGLMLATVWSGMEILDFDRHVHWPFLAVWVLFAGPALYRGWKWATAAGIASLAAWCLMIMLDWPGTELWLLQVFVLLGAALHLAGVAVQDIPRLACLSTVIRRSALLAALFAAHFFIYVGMHGLPWYTFSALGFDSQGWSRGTADGPGTVALIVVLALTALALAANSYRRVAGRRSTRDIFGMALAVLTTAAMLATPVLPGRYADAVLMYVILNGLVFAVLIWMVVDGYRSGERFQVYAAFVAYGAGLIAVYFMEFFSLMSRSLFVMAGGAVLIVGVHFLERQRRRSEGPRVGGVR